MALIAWLPDSMLRVTLGLPFVLFFPGYTLVAALYPRRDDLSGVERLALSLGLSLAVVPLIGLALNYTPWGIRRAPIAASLTLFIAACSLVAVRRRRRLSSSERVSADVRPVIRSIRGLPWPSIGISVATITLILFLGVRYGVLGGSRVGEPFTEFYVLGPNGKAEAYPQRLFAGEEAHVVLGIVNREGKTASYAVQVRAAGEVLRTLRPGSLEDGQKWEDRVAFSVRQPGERVRVEFLLFTNGAGAPSRSLHLWLKVRAP